MLAAPRRRYGADARLLFKLKDLVFDMAPAVPEFRADRPYAYQSWEQAAIPSGLSARPPPGA